MRRFVKLTLLLAVLAAPALLLAQDEAPLPAASPEFLVGPGTTGCGTATNIGSGNTALLYVDGYPCSSVDYPDVNQPYTNVKICAPGSTTNCQVIDHVIIDSGSDGLRVVGSVLKSTLLSKMPAFQYGGKNVTECEIYVSSYVYGPIRTADVYIAGKVVKNYPLQVIDAKNYPVPSACSSQGGTATNDANAFDGKGLIGVAFPLTDTGLYFSCNSTWKGCVENRWTGMPNITTKFAADNNGVAMTAPAISVNGSASAVTGTLVFGVGTQANNTPPANTIPIYNDSDYGTFNDSINGNVNTMYIDSGTNTMLVSNTGSKYAECTDGSGYYCPKTNASVPVKMWSLKQTKPQITLTYIMGNYDTLSLKNDPAYNDEVGVVDTSSSAGGSDVLGMGNFFGHTMYFVFNGKTAKWSNGTALTTFTGPINAVTPQK